MSASYSFNPEFITFNICYNASDFIADYAFTAHSTWVLIDQEGKIANRWNDNIDPAMFDIIKTEIDALLQ